MSLEWFLFGLLTSAVVLIAHNSYLNMKSDQEEDQDLLEEVVEAPDHFERCRKCRHWLRIWDYKKKLICDRCGHKQ